MTCLCQVVRWNEIGRDENVVNSYPHHYSHDVLYWSLLYCTVLHCTVLYCIVFHFRIPRMHHLHFSLVRPSIHPFIGYTFRDITSLPSCSIRSCAHPCTSLISISLPFTASHVISLYLTSLHSTSPTFTSPLFTSTHLISPHSHWRWLTGWRE